MSDTQEIINLVKDYAEGYRERVAQLEAENERYRAVVEAAIEFEKVKNDWLSSEMTTTVPFVRAERALSAAVKALAAPEDSK